MHTPTRTTPLDRVVEAHDESPHSNASADLVPEQRSIPFILPPVTSLVQPPKDIAADAEDAAFFASWPIDTVQADDRSLQDSPVASAASTESAALHGGDLQTRGSKPPLTSPSEPTQDQPSPHISGGSNGSVSAASLAAPAVDGSRRRVSSSDRAEWPRPRLPRIVSSEVLDADAHNDLSAAELKAGKHESSTPHSSGRGGAAADTPSSTSEGACYDGGSQHKSPFAAQAATAAPEDATSSQDERTMLEFDEDEDAYLAAQLSTPQYKRWWLLKILIPLLVSAVILIAGITVRIVFPQTYVSGNFTSWRWIILIGCLAPAYWLGEGIAHLVEAAVEWQFFQNRRVLYYIIGTTDPLARMIKAALMPMLWAVIFRQQSYINSAWNSVFTYILRVLLCIFLFTVCLFLTTVIAKVLASYFHSETFFDQMADTLKKEYYLEALSRPRDGLSTPDRVATVAASPKKAAAADPMSLSSPIPSKLNGMQSTSPVKNRVEAESPRRGAPAGKVPRPTASSVMSAATSGSGFAGRSSGRRASQEGGAIGWSGRSQQKLASVLGDITKGRKVRPTPEMESVKEESALKAPDLSKATILKRLSRVEAHIHDSSYAMTFDDTLARAKDAKASTREREAKRLAFYIFWNCKSEYDRNYIKADDFLTFMTEQKAKTAFDMFDLDGSGKITQTEVHDVVLQIFTERRNLALALKDTRSVVGTLTYVLGAILQAVFFFFYLLVLRISLDNMWITISSGVLSFSFIFGPTMSKQLQAILLLFVVHPFDVGDTLMMDGNFVTVEEMSLNKTVVLTWEGKRTWYPNALLTGAPVLNLTRADNRRNVCKVDVDVALPKEAYQKLEKVLAAHIKAHQADFKEGSLAVAITGSTVALKNTLTVNYTSSMNGWDDARYPLIRHEMNLLVGRTLTELGFEYSLPRMHKRSPLEAIQTALVEQ